MTKFRDAELEIVRVLECEFYNKLPQVYVTLGVGRIFHFLLKKSTSKYEICAKFL